MAVGGPLAESYELGPIRPPSEAFSLLIRVTRNCPWNRCAFCPIYKGTKFELRTAEEIKRDIDTAKLISDYISDLARSSGVPVRETAASVVNSAASEACRNVGLWMYAGGSHAFLQDANSLIMKTPDLLEVLNYLKTTFPDIDRITSYLRSKTAARKTLDELKALHDAGLSRLHIGLESGYDPVLAFMEKGTTAADHITGGKNVVASGISLSEYVMLGAGGATMWREHALETARVLNEINPDFIRFRTLTVRDGMPLREKVAGGEFVRATDEQIIEEEQLLIENLTGTSTIASDHSINLLPEIEGRLPEEKDAMLEVIARFQAMPPEERDIYKLGRRLGIYDRLDELSDTSRRAEVVRVMEQVTGNDDVSLDDVLFKLMERYI
ncbi:MAG: radical SAM protein [Dehalococcoidales bacterium]|nr:radical SAM protein [Dehalococcoidales bacterium]